MRTKVFIFFLFMVFQLVCKAVHANSYGFSPAKEHPATASPTQFLQAAAFITSPNNADDILPNSLTDMEDEDELIRKYSLVTICLLAFACSFLLLQARPDLNQPSVYSYPFLGSSTPKYIAQRVIRI